MEQQDRYCRNCGQQLLQEDRFCAGCGRSVYDTAHVPTPEADVPVPPVQAPVQPPQGGQDVGEQDANRGPKWVMLAVFFILATVETVQGMEPASSGETLAYRIGSGIPSGVVVTVAVAAFLLLISGVYYVTARKDGTTFRESIFNWPMVILAGIVAVLALLG
jgi:hypothetical protein